MLAGKETIINLIGLILNKVNSDEIFYLEMECDEAEIKISRKAYNEVKEKIEGFDNVFVCDMKFFNKNNMASDAIMINWLRFDE